MQLAEIISAIVCKKQLFSKIVYNKKCTDNLNSYKLPFYKLEMTQLFI